MIGAKLKQSDVDSLYKDITEFIRNVEKEINTGLAKAGNKTYDMIRNNIGTHDPYGPTSIYGISWRALTPGWIEEKKKAGESIEKWAQTGDIGSSVEQIQTFNPKEIFIGIDGDRYPYAFEKSINNEFGYDRPLFMTVGNKISADMETGTNDINDIFDDVLSKATKGIWEG